MRIILAPMEGLADFWLRDIITSFGGIDLVINEFVRVVDRPLPDEVFYKNAPELNNDSSTSNGTPSRIQLLGSHPQAMAENAQIAIRLGSKGVDLNFGCPSKTVNNHCGGAALLKTPDAIFDIVSAVRKALPAKVTLSAKMRLGFDNTDLALENAKAIEDAGANELTVHGRTRQQGYKPPAYWDWVGKINDHINIPVIANGEIWNEKDYQQCLRESGCSDIMIGRALVRQPDLAAQIKHQQTPQSWQALKPKLEWFIQGTRSHMRDAYVSGRVKQWLNHLREHYPEAASVFNEIRREKDIAVILTKVLAS